MVFFVSKFVLLSSVIYSNFLLVSCVIPSLSVIKVNSKFIEKRRQDTLEICKLFNEENNRHKISNINKLSPSKHRLKRDVDSNKIDNPVLKLQDIMRVEKIIDKLYDDGEENGNHITYRQRNVGNVTKAVNRRFNFAPAQLFGPSSKEEESTPTSNVVKLADVNIPWIKKWKHGILPYFIDSNTYDSLLSETILKAFEYIEKVTCIRLQRLREKPVDQQSLQNVEWLYITNPSGIRQCVHSNERKPNTGVQMVVLGYDCLSQGEIAHEIMHVLGFSHEHTRSDRDRYITILWDNIKPGYKKYFMTRQGDRLLNLPYDYASVLHYPSRAFSKNGQITVMANSDTKVGQREVLSELDVEKIGIIYGRECVIRNTDYLLKTCPSVVKEAPQPEEALPEHIDEYFKDRIWPYGIVNYQMKDNLEFSAEERENIKAVFDHIEKETCIEFRDITEENDLDDKETTTESSKEATTVTKRTTGYGDKIILTRIIPQEKALIESETTTNKISLNKLKMTNFHNSTQDTRLSYMKINGDEDTSDESARRYVKTQSYRNRTVLPQSPARRHAANVLMLSRSTKPGCQCPEPGRPNGNKELIISADCFNSVNDLLHLFVHVLGLDHQHNMHDRDSFLHIEWDNLTPEIAEDVKTKLPPAASAGFAYDYQSVMHYPWLRIKDGITKIMLPIWNDGWAMGHWQGLSSTDVQKINLIYTGECEKRKEHTRNI